jgi:hypothetical protein
LPEKSRVLPKRTVNAARTTVYGNPTVAQAVIGDSRLIAVRLLWNAYLRQWHENIVLRALVRYDVFTLFLPSGSLSRLRSTDSRLRMPLEIVLASKIMNRHRKLRERSFLNVNMNVIRYFNVNAILNVNKNVILNVSVNVNENEYVTMNVRLNGNVNVDMNVNLNVNVNMNVIFKV